jgi:hypothetical protein
MDAFTSYSREEKTAFLLRLVHELTIIARDTYDPESGGVNNPLRLRLINEIQHRIISSAIALAKNDPRRYPDDVLVGIILHHPEDIELQRQLKEAVERLLSQEVTA